MQNIQEIFNRIQEIKKEMKDIRSAYREALKSSEAYQDAVDEAKRIREKKKQIEQGIKDEFASELMKLEDLQIDLASEMELLSDAALTNYSKGETVEVEDQYGNPYEPIFSVKFKKS